MANAETLTRFQNAAMNARQLPPDLLTNSQELKLYALYKQTEQTAPEDPPPTCEPGRTRQGGRPSLVLH